LFGSQDELTAQLRRVVEAPHAPELDRFRSETRERVRTHYSWDAVTTQYEELWRRLGARG
jgi:glycosyltransferase involved in cell wall biosynthesis